MLNRESPFTSNSRGIVLIVKSESSSKSSMPGKRSIDISSIPERYFGPWVRLHNSAFISQNKKITDTGSSISQLILLSDHHFLVHSFPKKNTYIMILRRMKLALYFLLRVPDFLKMAHLINLPKKSKDLIKEE